MKTIATSRGRRRATFRLFLQEELARRCGANPRYSLRAFALDLGTDHATLGQLVRGKRRSTEATIRRLCRALGLADERADRFVDEERLDAAEAAPRRRHTTELAAATVRAIAGWQHLAILELVRLESFRPDVRWIARVLGIGLDEAQLALQTLLRLGLLEMRTPERWIDLAGEAIGDLEGLDEAALERAAGESRELVARSLRRDAREASEHAVTTLAVSAARLPEALERLARLRAELVALFAQDERPDAVVRLEVHLYPLTTGTAASGATDVASDRAVRLATDTDTDTRHTPSEER